MTMQTPVPLPTLPPPVARPPRRGFVARIVVAVIVVVAAIAVVGVVLLSRESKPATPTGLHLVGKTAVSVTIGWQQGSSKVPTLYRVYRNGARISSVSGTTLQFRDVGLRPSTAYSYEVSAYTSGKESSRTPALAVTTNAASLASARLLGQYDVRMRVTSEYGYTNIARGDTDNLDWWFTQRAAGGTGVNGESWAGDGWTMPLTHSGRSYAGHTTESLSRCFVTSVNTSVRLALRVTAANVVGSRWTATRFTGTLTQVAPRTVSGLYICPGARFTATVTGTLHSG